MHKQTEHYQQSNANLPTWLKGSHDIIGKWRNLIWFNSVIIYCLFKVLPDDVGYVRMEERVYARWGYGFPGGPEQLHMGFSLLPKLLSRDAGRTPLSKYPDGPGLRSGPKPGGHSQQDGSTPQISLAQPARCPLSFPSLTWARGSSPAANDADAADDWLCLPFISFHCSSWSPVVTSGPSEGSVPAVPLITRSVFVNIKV